MVIINILYVVIMLSMIGSDILIIRGSSQRFGRSGPRKVENSVLTFKYYRERENNYVSAIVGSKWIPKH